MKYEIAIQVDTNDADYVTEISTIDETQLAIIMPLIEAIKQWMADNPELYGLEHNYDIHEYTRATQTPRERYGFPEEVHDMFEDLCGYPGEYGFHTVESITLTPWVEKTRLL